MKQPLPQLSLWVNLLCCWEHQAPSCLGRNYLPEFVIRCLIRMDELLCTLGEGIFSVSTGILSCCKLDLLKCTMSKIKQRPWKEGEMRVLVWHTPPQVHLLMVNMLPPQMSVYGMHNQVKFPKATNFPLFKTRWEHSVFLGTTILSPPPLTWRSL